ncbi:MAG: carbamoyl transferase [Gammaproteobacteria bacterium]|nr:carbamoyl transferase [Gammaproteobacteria bacterium]
MKKNSYILAINYLGHDTSAAISYNSRIIAACEEERYNKDKHTRKFPINAINDCLKIVGIKINDLEAIAFCDRPQFAISEMYLKPALDDKKKLDFIDRDKEKIKNFLNVEYQIRKETKFNGNIKFYSHHLCHLAGSYYSSGFKDSLLFSIDGLGDNVSNHVGNGVNYEINLLHKGSKFPNSLGLFYSAITDYLGWRHHCDEGIIMALASYGNPYQKISSKSKDSYLDIMREIIKNKKDFDIVINPDYTSYQYEKDTWVSKKFLKIFGPRRKYNHKITSNHINISSALQKRLEEIVFMQLKKAKKLTGQKKLCLTGGVALNCSMNGKILQSKIFDEIFVQPASGDNGTAIGGCYLASKDLKKFKPIKDWDSYKGSDFNDEQIKKVLKNKKCLFTKPKNLYKEVAKQLANGKIVSWFQGKAEFGPRALGNRSILAKPFPISMKDYINKNVKFRENFRPLAPAILKEKSKYYFKLNQEETPHMLQAIKVKTICYKETPAIIHEDGTARVQTVSKKMNMKFWKLIKEFEKITGCPVLINTSFNVKGQPIVNSPVDAINCFLSTKIDCLCIGSFIVKKNTNEK